MVAALILAEALETQVVLAPNQLLAVSHLEVVVVGLVLLPINLLRGVSVLEVVAVVVLLVVGSISLVLGALVALVALSVLALSAEVVQVVAVSVSVVLLLPVGDLIRHRVGPSLPQDCYLTKQVVV